MIIRAFGLCCLAFALSLLAMVEVAARDRTEVATAAASTVDTFPAFLVQGQVPARIDVGPRMGMLIDRTKALTHAHIIAPDLAWQPITRRSPNFGFTRDAYWFRFQIDNQDAHNTQRLVELPITFIDDVQFFHYAGGRLVTSYALGDEKPFAQRPIKHPSFVMPVSLVPGVNHIYIRLASAGSIEAPFRIWDPLKFHESSSNENLVHGAVAGILLIMIVYNLFIFFATDDINYIYYVVFVACYLLFHFTLTGYTFAYVWPNAIRWNSFALSTSISSCALFACLFATNFLKLSTFSAPAFYLMRGLTGASAVLLVLTFVLPYSITIRLGSTLVIPVAITALVLGYWRWWRGARFARFYCLAWTAVLMGVSVLVSGKFGVIPSNAWTNSAHEIGIVLLVLLLAITLADRINHDRTRRIKAQSIALAHERRARASQEALIRAKEAANRKLERRVKARTTDLNKTLDKLKVANDLLLLLARTDGLTQINNRAFFDNALIEEHRRATRVNSSLALIIFDVDHFKKINDTYGHPGGDACLRALSALVRPRINRAGDVLARYGGEEFVILLIDSSLDNALALAESLRAEIEQFEVPFEGGHIRFTASFGVACAIPASNMGPHELLANADKALYEAKHAGRNCVRSMAMPDKTA
ncbi:MAG: GGDEF domain-containing protein [Rhodoferax sp.]|nr:GGDEF domain-containing protein [Rhodoferax sp.]